MMRDLTRKRFNVEEDQTIREPVTRYSTTNWDEIVKALGGNRIKRQLRERWQVCATSDITFMSTEAENEQLEALFFEFATQCVTGQSNS
jgi:hypothetical protein